MPAEEHINLKSVLTDIARELDGESVDGVFEVNGHKFLMKLLNEEESNWRNAHVITVNRLSAVSSFRLPTLAICIRGIDGIDIIDFFDEKWKELKKEEKEMFGGEDNKFARKYFAAEQLMSWLSQLNPDSVGKLFDEYQKLQERRNKVQANLKKSSGENSDQE